MPLRQRAHAVRAQEAVLVEHVREDAPELVRIDECEADPLLDAAVREVGEAFEQVLAVVEEPAEALAEVAVTRAGCRGRRPRSRGAG